MGGTRKDTVVTVHGTVGATNCAEVVPWFVVAGTTKTRSSDNRERSSLLSSKFRPKLDNILRIMLP
jgi:hypothetical protein